MRKLSPGMIAALLLALFAFGASIHINSTIFERLPHLEDEFAYLFQAKIFAGGHLSVPRSPDTPVAVFWQPFVIQPDTPVDGVLTRFGKYTPGWPLVLSLSVLMNAPWVANAFLAALTVVLIYRIGREVFDEAVGVVGALLMAISPMALLLNATLMSHTSALFFTMVFLYGYWRLTRISMRTPHHWRNLLGWGALAGVAIGWVVMTRPLTAVAMAAPVALHALSRFLDALADAQQRQKIVRWVIAPMLVLAIFALPLVGFIFFFNHAVTGTWRAELYTLQWPYDQAGFGENHGLMAGGHTLEFGLRNGRDDLGFWLRDLFGWTLDPNLAKYAADNLGWGAGVGLSGFVVALGLIAGRKKEWIWLFFELFVAIVLAQLTYWIGSAVHGYAVYSIRYYFEATGGIVLISAYGIVALARSWHTPLEGIQKSALNLTNSFTDRLKVAWNTLWPGYIILLIAAGMSVAGYTPARFREPLEGWPNGLYRYNEIGQQELDALNAVREPGKPVLVVVLHTPNTPSDDWRDYGALMANTSPYLNTDIIVGRIYDPAEVDKYVQRFPGRQVLYEVGKSFYTTQAEALQN